MSDDWIEQQRAQRFAEELERLNEASRNSMFDAGAKALWEAGQAQQKSNNDFYAGMNGMAAPLTGDMGSYFQGKAIRDAREAEEQANRHGTPVYTHFSTARAPVPPTEAELEAARMQKRIEEEWSHSDGYYGVILNHNALEPGLRAAYLKGRKDFIDEQRKNPAYNIPEEQVQAYISGGVYAPYQAFRTYNPLIAMEKGFHSVSVNGKMSDGADWCHMRGGGIGRAYSDFRRDFLDAYEVELDRREKMWPPRRAFLNVALPLFLPPKSEYVQHAESFLHMYEWFIKTSASQPKTGSCMGAPRP